MAYPLKGSIGRYLVSLCLLSTLILANITQISEAANVYPSKLVFAHWIVPMPYTEGQSGAERNKDDIRAALEAGIDGFVFDVFTGAQARNVLKQYISAANAIGADKFRVFLSIDTARKFNPRDIVDVLLNFGSDRHYLKLNDKPVLSSYGTQDDAWWRKNVIQPLAMRGHHVAFIPYFHLPNPNGDTPTRAAWAGRLATAPSVDGLFPFIIPGSLPFYTGDSNLGHHWWSTLEAQENLASALSDKNKIFMGQYMPYYWAICHSAGQYLEFQAGRGMANAWTSIIEKQKPDLVEIVTWNDYSESTFIQPTRLPATKNRDVVPQPHLGYYELLKYYISWYKTGVRPQITRDSVFYAYRTQPLLAKPQGTADKCRPATTPPNQIWGSVKDVIYVTTALTADAEVHVRSGSTSHVVKVAAGLNTVDVPFSPGPQSIEIWRDGRVITEGKGVDIVAIPSVQNFNVYSGYSIAGGKNSSNWLPSEDWRYGLYASWFR
jgi:hypothetical protein